MKCDCIKNRYTFKQYVCTGTRFPRKKGNKTVGNTPYMHRYWIKCVNCGELMVTFKYEIADPTNYIIGL